MLRIKRAGMLIILLAFPALFFLFLKTCGTNHYDLPYFHPLLKNNQVVWKGPDTVYYQVSGILGVTPQGDTVSSDVLTNRVNVFFLDGRDDEGKVNLDRHKNRILERLANEKAHHQFPITSLHWLYPTKPEFRFTSSRCNSRRHWLKQLFFQLKVKRNTKR